jgi:hypothetical protein
MRCPCCHIGYVDEMGICSYCLSDHDLGVVHYAMGGVSELILSRPRRVKLAIVPSEPSHTNRE